MAGPAQAGPPGVRRAGVSRAPRTAPYAAFVDLALPDVQVLDALRFAVQRRGTSGPAAPR